MQYNKNVEVTARIYVGELMVVMFSKVRFQSLGCRDQQTNTGESRVGELRVYVGL